MMNDKAGAADDSEATIPGSITRRIAPGRSRTYVLVILTLVYVVNYLDRQVLGILLPQIQTEFLLTDTQLGLLSGTAFAVVYAILGIPLAILADRISRRNIIAASLGVFSLMTVLSGYVTHYWQLLLARLFTGVGEAGTAPSINSIISDLYPPEKRASALAFYAAGLNVGLLIGYFGGGYIAEHYGWRNAFLAAGIPGLVLVVLLLLTVREPQRGFVDNLADNLPPPPVFQVVRFLWSRRSFCWMAAGTALTSFGGYAGIFFVPKFLLVSHHLSLVQVGILMAILTGIPGAAGTYFSGVLADRFGRQDMRWYMYIPIIAAVLSACATPIFFLSQNLALAISGGIITTMMGAAFVGPAFAMTQALVPLRMRALSIAILLFVLNMVGLGLGPLVVGFVSESLKPMLGDDSLRYALHTGIITGLSGALCYWQASKTLLADLTLVKHMQAPLT